MDLKTQKMIIKCAKNGMKEADICEHVGYSRASVRGVLIEKGIKIRDFSTGVLKAKILRAYDKLGCYQKVSRRLGVSYSKVYYYVSRYYEGNRNV